MKFISRLLPHQRMAYLQPQFFKCIFFAATWIAFSLPGFSQQKTEQSSWWFGVAGGANFNSYSGYTSALNVDINASPAFGKGHGVGGYYAALIEFHPQGALLGLMLQQGADNRRGSFKNSGRRLEAKISYYTIEPSLMIMPVKRIPFYLYAGPRLGLLWGTRFTYKEPNKPEYPQERVNPKAYIKNLDKVSVSMQVGIGYDLLLPRKRTGNWQLVAAPFITYLPSLGENLRTIEKLELNTLRAGIVLKAGRVPGTE